MHLNKTGLAMLFLAAASMIAAGAIQARNDAACLDDAARPKPSTYAPIKDLQQQVGYFLQRIQTDLSDPDDYTEDQQGRIEKDASTLVVIGAVMAHHDEEGAHRRVGAAIVPAADKLAASVKNYERAKDALAALEKAIDEGSDADAPDLEGVADLATLMQQVPIVNNALRRSVSGRNFNREIDRAAGLAATMAALSEISWHDTNYCAGEDEEKIWREVCDEMRDASAEANRAIRANDLDAATLALDRVARTCDACHEHFRH